MAFSVLYTAAFQRASGRCEDAGAVLFRVDSSGIYDRKVIFEYPPELLPER